MKYRGCLPETFIDKDTYPTPEDWERWLKEYKNDESYKKIKRLSTECLTHDNLPQTLYHVNFRPHADGENTYHRHFIPYIPYTTLYEDDKLPRICFSDDIKKAIIAIPWLIRPGDKIRIYTLDTNKIDVTNIIEPFVLDQYGLVEDAIANSEYWYLHDVTLTGNDYIVENLIYGEKKIVWDALSIKRIDRALYAIQKVDPTNEQISKILNETKYKIGDDPHALLKEICEKLRSNGHDGILDLFMTELTTQIGMHTIEIKQLDLINA